MTLSRVGKHQPPMGSLKKHVFIVSVLLLFSTLAVFLFTKAKETDRFPIRHVAVFGVKRSNQKDLQRLLAPLVAKGFFAVDIGAIKQRVAQTPWVADVAVRRVWPDRVMVTVFERDPIARWNGDSLLSTRGDIFAPNPSEYPAALPQFIGSAGQQMNMLVYYTELNRIVQPLHLNITRLELTPYLAWNITFENGMKINLGYKDVLTRINHFVKVYQKIVEDKAALNIDYVDLQYPNGLAVRWKTV